MSAKIRYHNLVSFNVHFGITGRLPSWSRHSFVLLSASWIFVFNIKLTDHKARCHRHRSLSEICIVNLPICLSTDKMWVHVGGFQFSDGHHWNFLPSFLSAPHPPSLHSELFLTNKDWSVIEILMVFNLSAAPAQSSHQYK